jgi:hypothetical protein
MLPFDDALGVTRKLSFGNGAGLGGTANGSVRALCPTCGALVRGDEVWLYYGAADTCVGLAIAKLGDLLDAVREGGA